MTATTTALPFPKAVEAKLDTTFEKWVIDSCTVDPEVEWNGTPCHLWNKKSTFSWYYEGIYYNITIRRAVWEYVYGTLDDTQKKKKNLMVLCGNLQCVNVEHILPNNVEAVRALPSAKYQAFIERKVSLNSEQKQDHRWERDGCLLWTGARCMKGYARLNIGDSNFSMHREVARAYYGHEMVEGTSVHHKCANKSCVNYKHLQVVDQESNTAEMFARKYYENRIAEGEELLRDLLNVLDPEGDHADRVRTFLAASK